MSYSPSLSDCDSLCSSIASQVDFKSLASRAAFDSVAHGRYVLGQQLGSGASGSVYLATSASGATVAVKIMLRSKIPNSRLALFNDPITGATQVLPMEVYILRHLNHGNIIKFVEMMEDDTYFFVVTEFHGDLSKQCTRPTDLFECIESNGALPEKVALYVFRQLVEVVAYMRSMNVYHMDLKDENIVIDSNFNVKLVDFGSAHILPPSARSRTDLSALQFKFFGTAEYAPPEILREQSYHPELADCWSLGVVLYTMLFAQPPFATLQHAAAVKFAPLRHRIKLSRFSCGLISNLLAGDANARFDVSECMEYLASSTNVVA